MKKFVFVTTLLIVLCISFSAFAAPYQDATGSFSIAVPEGDRIYYYTPEGTNMSDELLASVQDSSADVSLLVASYGQDNSLSYSLDISKTPITDPAALMNPIETAATASGDTQPPSSPASSAGTDVITDLSMLPEAQLGQLALEKTTEYGSDYVFDDYTTETLNGGKTALVLTGRYAEDNGYTTKIYQVAQDNTLFSITILYKNDANDAYWNEAQGVLNTLQFTSAESAAASPTTLPTATPAPVLIADTTPAPSSMQASFTPTGSASPQATSGFFENLGSRIQYAYYNDPNFALYLIAGIIAIAVVIIIIVLVRSRRKGSAGRRGRAGDADAGDRDEPGDSKAQQQDTPDSPVAKQYQEDISRYTQQPKGYDMRDISRYTQQPKGYSDDQGVGTPQGYTPEDISRYTQQPSGYDVADVSKFVHQVKSPEAQGEPATEKASVPRPDGAPKVGSRMERHRKKK